jgi:hypothetical protein
LTKELVDAGSARCPRDSVQLGLQLKILLAGGLSVEACLLTDGADRTANLVRVALDVEAGDPCLAARGARERREDLQGGRLAGPVRPEQSEHRPLGDGERDPVKGADPARIRLGEPVRLDGVCEHHSSLNVVSIEHC